MSMEKEDARYQTLEQLHERRKQVVRLYKKGYGVMHIAELSGLSYPTVRGTIERYEAGGERAIKPTSRGKKLGEGRMLSEEQEELIRRLVSESTPEQLLIKRKTWTRAAVMELMARECAVAMSERGVGNYLKRWGINSKKKIQAAINQNPSSPRPKPVAKWWEQVMPISSTPKSYSDVIVVEPL